MPVIIEAPFNFDKLATQYTARVLAYNMTTGDYDEVFTRDLDTDFYMTDVPNGVLPGTVYVIVVEAELDDVTRRSASFGSVRAEPIRKSGATVLHT